MKLRETKACARYPDVSLTLIPPSPVTDQITLDVRGAIRNASDTARNARVSMAQT